LVKISLKILFLAIFIFKRINLPSIPFPSPSHPLPIPFPIGEGDGKGMGRGWEKGRGKIIFTKY